MRVLRVLRGSVKHSAAMGLALLGGECWGLAGDWGGPGGLEWGFTWGKQRDCGAFWRGCRGAGASGILWWDRVGERRWRGDDFTRGR